MARLADLRLDETSWNNATELRRADWRVLRDELLDEGDFHDLLSGLHLLATLQAEEILLEALDDDGLVRRTMRIPHALLRDPVAEYQAIIHRLDQHAAHRDATWFEAIDTAKKVVHDRAAALLAQSVAELSTDLPTLRRVFTFVFALLVDTTHMIHDRGHGRR